MKVFLTNKLVNYSNKKCEYIFITCTDGTIEIK